MAHRALDFKGLPSLIKRGGINPDGVHWVQRDNGSSLQNIPKVERQ